MPDMKECMKLLTDVLKGAYQDAQLPCSQSSLDDCVQELEVNVEEDFESALLSGVDLHAHVMCSKNPGHVNFIPVSAFTEDCLPSPIKEDSKLANMLVDLVKAMAELTVYIKAHFISEQRPMNILPFSSFRGEHLRRTASGYIKWVVQCGQGGELLTSESCNCANCKDSCKPKKTWWLVHVVTSCHVIFDQNEVVETDIAFFYDEQSTETFMTKGHTLIESSIEADRTEFSVIVHNKFVGQRLLKAWNSFRDAIKVQYMGTEACSRLTIIISHPHGCSKHISLGERIGDKQELVSGNLIEKDSPFVRACYTRITYTNNTCRGSSGGMVFSLWGWGLPVYITYPHSMTCGPDRRTNRSGGGLMQWLMPKTDISKTLMVKSVATKLLQIAQEFQTANTYSTQLLVNQTATSLSRCMMTLKEIETNSVYRYLRLLFGLPLPIETGL